MMSFLKHLQISNLLIIFLTAALFFGCGKEKKKIDYVARVNDSFLTKDEYHKLLAESSNKNFYKAEVIRNWINRELLYQEAKSEGIEKSDEFKKTIEESRKDLAIAKLLENHYNDNGSSLDQKDIEKYFEVHKNEFKTNDKYYLINFISFTNEDNAVHFRTTVLESNWSKALIAFKTDPSIYNEKSDWFLSEHEIEPITLLRLIQELNQDEISIVLSDDQNKYLVVQLLQKFDKGIVPPLNLISKSVEKRFLAEEKQDIIKNYIKDLYSKNEIDVKN